jgi:thiamine monophosphate synthase
MFAVLGLPAQYVRADRRTGELPLDVRLVRIDEPALAPDQRIAFARRIGAARPAARVMLSGSTQEVARAGAGGLHSSSHDLRTRAERPAVPLWAVSCADAGDLTRAVALGADLALLAPGYAGAASVPPHVPIPLYQEDDTGSAVRIDGVTR